MEKVWEFPGGFNLTPTGSNGAGIETFLDNIPLSVTREVLQNSIDAHRQELDKPVRVTFSFTEWNTVDIPGVTDLKENILPKAELFWTEKKNQDTLKYLKNVKDTLSKPTVKVLIISDYNTTGLNESNFNSLIAGDGYSDKPDETSAGSKGIGKAAPFAASNLRMVFYNSKSTHNGDKFTGVINFVSYEDIHQSRINHNPSLGSNSGQYITQARGRLYSHLLKPALFDTNRVDYGTDLFVMGLKGLEHWKEKIIMAVLNNFLVALFNNKLEIEVAGTLINKEGLPELLSSIKARNGIEGYQFSAAERHAFGNTYSYYLALSSEDHHIIPLPEEMVEKYSFIESVEDAHLYLVRDDEKATRRVLQTRKSGMTIYERKGISGSISFSGVFHATGTELNKLLKRLENVNHDKWSPDREDDKDRKQSEEFLKDLFHWYKDKVEEYFGVSDEETIKAFGLSELLPMTGNNRGEKGETKDSGITHNVATINIKRKDNKKRTSALDGDGEDKVLNDILKSINLGEGEEGGSSVQQPGKGTGLHPGGKIGTGNDEGSSGESPEGKTVVSKQFIEVHHDNYIAMKILGINADSGLYRMIVIPSKSKNQLGFAFSSIGENGTEYHKELINPISPTGHTVTIEQEKKLLVHNINKGQRIVVDFTIPDKLKLKMKGIIYEVKS